MRTSFTLVLVVLVVLSEGPTDAVSSPPSSPASKPRPSFETLVEVESAARLLAVLMDSGRSVINENLLIPDSPDAGKSLHAAAGTARPEAGEALRHAPSLRPDFSPVMFERQLAETFLGRSGIDLRALPSARLSSSTKALLKQLVAASKTVVTEAQSGNSQDRVRPTVHLIPAVFGSRVALQFEAATGVRLKQTSLVPRNPANMPDEFERAVLREFADPAFQREKVITEVTAKSGVLRLMYPLYATRQCLACHGEPAGGELDRMGYRKEGWKLGQNAGAISVIMPIHP